MSPCGAFVDLARYLYRGLMRARKDDDGSIFAVDWQWCNAGASPLPFNIAFASSHFDPDPFDFGRVGEVRQRFYGRPETRLPGWLVGDHFCGTEDQWQEGYPADVVMPPLIDGVPTCCAAGLDGGAYDCGYSWGFETAGVCLDGGAYDCGYSWGFNTAGVCEG